MNKANLIILMEILTVTLIVLFGGCGPSDEQKLYGGDYVGNSTYIKIATIEESRVYHMYNSANYNGFLPEALNHALLDFKEKHKDLIIVGVHATNKNSNGYFIICEKRSK